MNDPKLTHKQLRERPKEIGKRKRCSWRKNDMILKGREIKRIKNEDHWLEQNRK